VSKAEVLAASLSDATRFLEKVLGTEPSDIQLAAAIQAFEFTYELSWKLLQAQLRDEGVESATPRAVFRSAGDAGLIPSVERWIGYLRARKLTSHTYREDTAEQVYGVISGSFVNDVKALLN
jgi:nucleotidyltransferase substrate binding protein (TIGR01987 family)